MLRVVGSGCLVRVAQDLPHEESCSRYRRPQPAHLQSRPWVAQEKRAAQLVGGRPTLASGSLYRDCDARKLKQFRVECKGTREETFRVTSELWGKVHATALASGEEPVLHVVLCRGTRRQLTLVLLRDEVQVHTEVRSLTLCIYTEVPSRWTLSPGRPVVVAHEGTLEELCSTQSESG